MRKNPIRKYPSPITHHPSPITHYPSPITHHLIPIITLILLSLAQFIHAGDPPHISGQLKFSGTLSHHESDSLFSVVGAGNYFDGQTDIRLKNTYYFADWGYILTHYEAFLTGGDTRRKTNELINLAGGAPKELEKVLGIHAVEDDRRLMDLTCIFTDEKSLVGYHRFDRLALGIRHRHGNVVIGRQAQTWGNGMVFNPMDLFNPFSPTDILRDYKIGADMVSMVLSAGDPGNLQILAVPRRDADHDVKWDQSSLAAKWHTTPGAVELDLMAARHYEDVVIGLGSMGYLGNAAWRVDGTWTFLKEQDGFGGDKNGFFSLVANMDYSWVWGEKNFYGFLELYHNGLGRSEYLDAFFDEHFINRLSRGELFTLGKNYFSAMMQYELHPLCNIFTTAILNLHDPSAVLLPRVVWDAKENLKVLAGATCFIGKNGTEFGGIEIPLTDLYVKQADSFFLWATWYF